MNRQEMDSFLRTAQLALQAGRLAQARERCEVALRHSPNDADALHTMGLILRRLGNATDAEHYIRRSLALAPGRADFVANYGNLLRARGRASEAAQRYREALAIDPALRIARLGLARVLNETDQGRAAQEELRRLIERDPQDAEAWNELGIALRALGRFGEAEQAYRRALHLNPRYGAASHNLGALLSHQKRAEAALAELDRAESLGVRGPQLHFNRARALYELGRFDASEEELMRAISIRSNDPQAHAMLAHLRFTRGDAHYTRELERAIAAHPTDVALRLTLANVYREAGALDAALQALEQASASCGPHPSLQLSVATTLQEAGDAAAALHVLREVQSRHANHPKLPYLMPPALMAAGHPDEAFMLTERARERAPDDQVLIAHHAVAARLLGDPIYAKLYDYDRFVQVFDLPAPTGWSSSDAFHRDLAEFLTGLHQLRAHPLGQSLRHGTQTVRSLLLEEHQALRAFMHSLEEPIAEYRARLGHAPAHPFLKRNQGKHRIVGCWSVRLQRGGYHVNHVHPEGWISSAYYVQVPEDSKDVEAQVGWLKLGEPRFAIVGVTPERMIEPRAGRLVLFPSYMWHGTTPITGSGPRMSIAFDVLAE